MIKISPSILSADFAEMGKAVELMEKSGADYIHCDVMDGAFVPNISFGPGMIKAIKKHTSLPLDVHLMVEHPNNTIELFLDELRPGDTVYIHPEAEYHPSTTLQKIINADMIPGIAINPGTSIETVTEMLKIVKKVLVMSVNPGNAGQMYLPYVGEKITRLAELREKAGFEIYWDGACGIDKIEQFAPQGVKGFVLGTTVLFGKKDSYADILTKLHKI